MIGNVLFCGITFAFFVFVTIYLSYTLPLPILLILCGMNLVIYGTWFLDSLVNYFKEEL